MSAILKKLGMPLAVLACFGCETEPAPQGEATAQGYAERMAALAEATGGRALGGGGYAWSDEDAILALTLTEHGTPTTLGDVKRMTPEERARALVEAAEWDLYDARKRMAELEGPNPRPMAPMTLAQDIANTRERIAHKEHQLQRRRNSTGFFGRR